MKERVGFVSNSSSSSFVMIGIKFPSVEEDKLKDFTGEYTDTDWNEGYELDFKAGTSFFSIFHGDNNKTNQFSYFGMPLLHTDCDGLDTKELSFDRLEKLKILVREQWKKFCGELSPDLEIAIHSGPFETLADP